MPWKAIYRTEENKKFSHHITAAMWNQGKAMCAITYLVGNAIQKRGRGLFKLSSIAIMLKLFTPFHFLLLWSKTDLLGSSGENSIVLYLDAKIFIADFIFK